MCIYILATSKKAKGPLKHVLLRRTNDDGSRTDVLECGHGEEVTDRFERVHRAKRRRCSTCGRTAVKRGAVVLVDSKGPLKKILSTETDPNSGFANDTLECGHIVVPPYNIHGYPKKAKRRRCAECRDMLLRSRNGGTDE